MPPRLRQNAPDMAEFQPSPLKALIHSRRVVALESALGAGVAQLTSAGAHSDLPGVGYLSGATASPLYRNRFTPLKSEELYCTFIIAGGR